MKPRPPRCGACGSYYAPVHADDQEGYGLPPQLCRCAFKRVLDGLAAEGWSQLGVEALPMVRKAGVPVRHHLGKFHPNGEAPYVTFARWVPAWVGPVLESVTLADAMKQAVLLRCAQAPERAVAALGVQRLSGTGAMVAFLLNDLAPTAHAPEDAPTEFAPVEDDYD